MVVLLSWRSSMRTNSVRTTGGGPGGDHWTLVWSSSPRGGRSSEGGAWRRSVAARGIGGGMRLPWSGNCRCREQRRRAGGSQLVHYEAKERVGIEAMLLSNSFEALDFTLDELEQDG